jgi:molecular chaperone HscB
MDVPMVCGHCHQLYDRSDLDHFALFGLSAQYDIDESLLRGRYLELSREIHPDAGGGDATKLIARVNEAHRVLTDPVLRAEYLLELRGGPSAAQRRNVSQDVLTWTLLAREELADASAAGDSAQVARIRAEIEARYDQAMREIAAASRVLSDDPASHTALRDQLNTVRYFQRLLEFAGDAE